METQNTGAPSVGSAQQEPRIPGEFQYWQQQNGAKAKWLRRGIKAITGVDPILPDEVIRKYAYSYYDADPVAEAFIDEVYMTRGQAAGRAMVDQALREGVDSVDDAPESLKRLFRICQFATTCALN